MMKMDFRNCLAAVAVLPLLLSGCVDDTYDLGRYDGSQENIVVGDVIETPPVSARLTFEGLLGGMDEIEKILADNGYTMDDIGLVEMFLPQELYQMTVPLDASFLSEDVHDIIVPDNSEDRVTLSLGVHSTLPMSVSLNVEFLDRNGLIVTAFEEVEVHKVEEGEVFDAWQEQDITELVSRFSEIASIKLTLLRPDLNKIKFLLENYLYVEARLKKEGGINISDLTGM